jgi:hypothetical protein
MTLRFGTFAGRYAEILRCAPFFRQGKQDDKLT